MLFKNRSFLTYSTSHLYTQQIDIYSIYVYLWLWQQIMVPPPSLVRFLWHILIEPSKINFIYKLVKVTVNNFSLFAHTLHFTVKHGTL